MARRYVAATEVLVRTGTCGSCKQPASLADFAALELWTALGAPLLPLGRYHVRDHCSACGRHRRIRLGEYRSRLSAAVVRSERAVGRRPMDLSAWLALVSSHASLGEVAAAEAAARRGLEQFPGEVTLLVRLGALLEQAGRADAALAPLADACARAAKDFSARLLHGRVLARLRRWNEAIDELREARRLDLRHPEPYWLLAQCHERQGRMSEALRSYEELLGHRPELRDDSEVWRRIGALKIGLGFQLTAAERKAASRFAAAGHSRTSTVALLPRLP